MKALEFSSQLVHLYPQNPVFASRHAETLLACGRYTEADPSVQLLLQRPDKRFQAAGHIFQGLIQEKHHRNYAQAKLSYQKALQLAAVDPSCSKEKCAVAYAGLGRIAAQEGNREEAREYYKKSLSVSDSKITSEEAKAFLNG